MNNNSPHLDYRLNSRGSKANSQQAPMHGLREITKAKLSQAKFGQVWVNLNNWSHSKIKKKYLKKLLGKCKWQRKAEKIEWSGGGEEGRESRI